MLKVVSIRGSRADNSHEGQKTQFSDLSFLSFSQGQHVVFEISGLRVEGLIQDMILRDVCHVEIIGTGGRVISLPSKDLRIPKGRF